MVLLDEAANEVKRWILKRGFPVRYQVSTLNAEAADVIIEMFEVAVEDMELSQ